MDERLSIATGDPGSIAQHIARYEYFSPMARGRSVLDAACGTGYGSQFLISAGADSYTGVDISPVALSEAREKYSDARAHFHQKSILELSGLGPFSCIFSFETIEHIREYEVFLKGLVPLLAKEGIFVVSTPVRKRGKLGDKPRNPYHTQEWTESEFRELLGKYFQVRDTYYQYGYRSFESAVVETYTRRFWRLVAKRQHRSLMRYPVVRSSSDLKTWIPLQPVFQILVCSHK